MNFWRRAKVFVRQEVPGRHEKAKDMPSRGPYWLTVAQAALELKLSTADVRRLIRAGKLPTIRIDSVNVCRISRDGVEYVTEEIAAGHLRISLDGD